MRTTIREHLTKLGVAESALRGHKRGTVASGGAQEDGGRAIEDVVTHNDWRPNAKRAPLFLGGEGMEGGDNVDAEDIAAANKAIAVTKAGSTRVHTYQALTRGLMGVSGRAHGRMTVNWNGPP